MDEQGRRHAALVLALIFAAAPLAGCLHPVNKGATAGAGTPAAAAPGTAAPPVASLPPPDDDPDHLMGLDASALRARLGAPSFLRRDNPAQLWRYAGQGCLLELYLYRSGPTDTYVVRHVAARPSPAGAAAVSARGCLAGLLRAHRHGSG